jgi:hypothetical protein
MAALNSACAVGTPPRRRPKGQQSPFPPGWTVLLCGCIQPLPGQPSSGPRRLIDTTPRPGTDWQQRAGARTSPRPEKLAAIPSEPPRFRGVVVDGSRSKPECSWVGRGASAAHTRRTNRTWLHRRNRRRSNDLRPHPGHRPTASRCVPRSVAASRSHCQWTRPNGPGSFTRRNGSPALAIRPTDRRRRRERVEGPPDSRRRQLPPPAAETKQGRRRAFAPAEGRGGPGVRPAQPYARLVAGDSEILSLAGGFPPRASETKRITGHWSRASSRPPMRCIAASTSGGAATQSRGIASSTSARPIA